MKDIDVSDWLACKMNTERAPSLMKGVTYILELGSHHPCMSMWVCDHECVYVCISAAVGTLSLKCEPSVEEEELKLMATGNADMDFPACNTMQVDLWVKATFLKLVSSRCVQMS